MSQKELFLTPSIPANALQLNPEDSKKLVTTFLTYPRSRIFNQKFCHSVGLRITVYKAILRLDDVYVRNSVNKYKVFLNGRNFWTNEDGEPKLMGFYTTRFVEADTPEMSGDAAVQLVREDGKLWKAVINDKSDPPMIYAVEMVMLETFDGIELPGTGYVFYEDENQGKA